MMYEDNDKNQYRSRNYEKEPNRNSRAETYNNWNEESP